MHRCGQVAAIVRIGEAQAGPDRASLRHAQVRVNGRRVHQHARIEDVARVEDRLHRGEGVDGLGEKFLEFLEALVAPVRNVGIGEHEAEQHSYPRGFDPLGEGVCRECGNDSGQRREPQKISGAQ